MLVEQGKGVPLRGQCFCLGVHPLLGAGGTKSAKSWTMKSVSREWEDANAESLKWRTC